VRICRRIGSKDFRKGSCTMLQFTAKRLWQAFLILLGVNILTFLLFFGVNTTDDMARLNLGGKRVTPAAIEQWKAAHDYDKPLWWNSAASGTQQATQTLFAQKSMGLFALRFGSSDTGRDIAHDIAVRAWPSLALAIPSFVLGMFVSIVVALGMLMLRYTRLDAWGVVLLVALMSISSMFYIIGGQWLFSKTLSLAPVSGYADGVEAWRFLILPLFIGLLSGLNKDYVRTAQAKGASDWQVLYKHVLRNALLPILTGAVGAIPRLFIGSLVMESFFGIPGLGSYLIEAINGQDFAVVRVMVFVGAAMTVLGYALTDIAYSVADPRVRLK
jgi:peptide/nickel transport system permease protein